MPCPRRRFTDEPVAFSPGERKTVHRETEACRKRGGFVSRGTRQFAGIGLPKIRRLQPAEAQTSRRERSAPDVAPAARCRGDAAVRPAVRRGAAGRQRGSTPDAAIRRTCRGSVDAAVATPRDAGPYSWLICDPNRRGLNRWGVMASKRYHSAVCAIAKDENTYVLEWAAYHLALGFEHVFLYDNMSRRALRRAFDPRRSRRHVSIQLWPTIPGRDAQIEAYMHYVLTDGRDVEWTAFIDLDEMVNLKRHATVGDFLKARAGADGIAINWRIFGSREAAVDRSDFVMKRFTHASHLEFDSNRLVKSIVRTERVVGASHHHAFYRDAVRIVSADGTSVDNGSQVTQTQENYEIAQINHYFVKSRAEWENKIRRGYTDGTVRDPGMFDAYDRNEVEDLTILRRLRSTQGWMRRIGTTRASAWRSLVACRGIVGRTVRRLST